MANILQTTDYHYCLFPYTPHPHLLPKLCSPTESKGCNLSDYAPFSPHTFCGLYPCHGSKGYLSQWRPVLLPGVDPFLCTGLRTVLEKAAEELGC